MQFIDFTVKKVLKKDLAVSGSCVCKNKAVDIEVTGEQPETTSREIRGW